jgi:hypothetical protein
MTLSCQRHGLVVQMGILSRYVEVSGFGGLGVDCWPLARLPNNILAHSSSFRRWDLSRRGGRGGTWWRKWERLNAEESNGKLPLRIFPGCSVPEPYQSPD